MVSNSFFCQIILSTKIPLSISIPCYMIFLPVKKYVTKHWDLLFCYIHKTTPLFCYRIYKMNSRMTIS